MSKSWGPGYFRSELFSLPPGLETMEKCCLNEIENLIPQRKLCNLN